MIVTIQNLENHAVDSSPSTPKWMFYLFCVHWHHTMPCNCEGTEQLRMIMLRLL